MSSVGHWDVGGNDAYHFHLLIGTSGFLSIKRKSSLKEIDSLLFLLWELPPIWQ